MLYATPLRLTLMINKETTHLLNYLLAVYMHEVMTGLIKLSYR